VTLISASPFVLESNPSPLGDDARRKLLENPGFGQVFTDHMALVRYTVDQGWHDAKICPRQSFRVDPATMVLHYAQEIFEGLKAYRLNDGTTGLFRPEANAKRLRHSARRMAMPELPDELFIESLRELLRVDGDWVPATPGHALYLRPYMFASGVALGVQPSKEYFYCVVASPAGPYFKRGSDAVTIWVSDNYTRAAPGGTGDAKCGGNYAAGLAAQAEAHAEHCDQVVFLDAVERRWIEELGGMNVFFVFDDGSIQTPPLSGTILAGIAIEQWQADAESGRLRESFACGTAAVIAPIGQVKGRKHCFTIGDGGAGPITERLKTALTDIQFGRVADPYGWLERLS